jgi:NifU-like protein
MSDVISKEGEKQKDWFYSKAVKEHFLKPKNIATEDKLVEEMKPNGVGEVGSPACGDVMKMWLKIEDGRIKKCLWRTFGCASAIASTSMLSVIITENGGMTLEDAEKVRPKDILERLGGLPKNKVHCSVLGDQALRAAIKNYQETSGKNSNSEN